MFWFCVLCFGCLGTYITVFFVGSGFWLVLLFVHFHVREFVLLYMFLFFLFFIWCHVRFVKEGVWCVLASALRWITTVGTRLMSTPPFPLGAFFLRGGGVELL